MKFFSSASESEQFLDQEGNSNNVTFLPAFNGLGAPFWDSDIRGGFYGITQDTTINDMTTASFLSITFQTKEIALILEKYNIEISKLLVDGGMVQNKTFCQLLADTLQKEIVKPTNVESTAVGACKVAMIGSGKAISKISSSNRISFKPNKSLKDHFLINYKSWKEYISNSLRN
jgi:glycerol kinase